MHINIVIWITLCMPSNPQLCDLLFCSHTELLCAAHHHGWSDHRHGPYTCRYRGGLSSAHVYHHSGCWRGRLQRHGVFGQRWQTAAGTQWGRRLQRHRAVCALQKIPGRQQLRGFSQPAFLCSAHTRKPECCWTSQLLILVTLCLQGNSVALAQSVLAELPDQVTSFFNAYKLKPPNLFNVPEPSW